MSTGFGPKYFQYVTGLLSDTSFRSGVKSSIGIFSYFLKECGWGSRYNNFLSD
jgi:hypothetical protein